VERMVNVIVNAVLFVQLVVLSVGVCSVGMVNANDNCIVGDCSMGLLCSSTVMKGQVVDEYEDCGN